MNPVIGMMDEAYFVGRRAILDWLNELCVLQLNKVEETASGAVACQVLDALFPGKVPMGRVNWGCKGEHEYVLNYKILQSVFTSLKVDKAIPVERLTKARYQDNLEWMQYLKAFYEHHYNEETIKQYDAVARRARGKNVDQCKAAAGDANAKMKAKSQATSKSKSNASKGKTANEPLSSTFRSGSKENYQRNQNRGNAGAESKSDSKNVKSSSNSTPSNSTLISTGKQTCKNSEANDKAIPQRERETSQHQGATRGIVPTAEGNDNEQSTSKQGSASDMKLVKRNESLRQEIAEVKRQLEAEKNAKLEVETDLSQLKEASLAVERERDFYFGKLRDVEVTLQGYEGKDPDLAENLLKILYATEDEMGNMTDEFISEESHIAGRNANDSINQSRISLSSQNPVEDQHKVEVQGDGDDDDDDDDNCDDDDDEVKEEEEEEVVDENPGTDTAVNHAATGAKDIPQTAKSELEDSNYDADADADIEEEEEEEEKEEEGEAEAEDEDDDNGEQGNEQSNFDNDDPLAEGEREEKHKDMLLDQENEDDAEAEADADAESENSGDNNDDKDVHNDNDTGIGNETTDDIDPNASDLL